MLSVVNWNIDENIVWYVRLADSGSAVSVEMYLTQADAEAQTNLQASGESSGYGSDLDVTLTNDPDATNPVSLFIDVYSWHLRVDGENGDPVKVYQVKRFVEIDEISHSIYRNSILIAARAAAEINAHTHAEIIRDIVLGTHLPEIDVGQIARLASDRRGVDDLGQIYEHRIIGTPNSLISEVETRKYIEIKR